MKRRFGLWVAVIAGLLSIGVAPTAAQTRVKLATMAPDGSAWHKALMGMGSEWQRAAGRWSVADGSTRVAPPATRRPWCARCVSDSWTPAGSPSSAWSRSIRRSRLSASLCLFDSYEELSGVLEACEPYFEERLEEKGFVLLNWAHGGWAHLFSGLEIRSVERSQAGEDLRLGGRRHQGPVVEGQRLQPRALAAPIS